MNLRYEHEYSPGYVVVVRETDLDERRVAEASGKRRYFGMSLNDFVGRLGGYEGELAVPGTGKTAYVSLEQWRGRDPDAVWLEIAFSTPVPNPDEELGSS